MPAPPSHSRPAQAQLATPVPLLGLTSGDARALGFDSRIRRWA
jgi:hypothetical protein